MKRIAVVATEKEYADFLMNNVAKYMNRYAAFVSYSIEEIERADLLKEDFVLLSAFNIFQQVRQKISEHSEIVVLSLSLSKRQMETLKEIPDGSRALLVNFDNRSCMHTITCMYDAGIRNWNCCPITARVITITASKPPLPPTKRTWFRRALPKSIT